MSNFHSQDHSCSQSKEGGGWFIMENCVFFHVSCHLEQFGGLSKLKKENLLIYLRFVVDTFPYLQTFLNSIIRNRKNNVITRLQSYFCSFSMNVKMFSLRFLSFPSVIVTCLVILIRVVLRFCITEI